MNYAERIKQARLLKGLTQAQLAKAVGVEQASIAYFESGRLSPSLPTAFAIAVATGVTPEFLERIPAPSMSQGSLAYRARASAKRGERDRAHQYLALLVEQMRQMSASLNLPRLKFPTPLGDPVQSARLTRVAFGINPNRPVNHVVNVVERYGGVVFGLPLTLDGVDAFSTWTIIDAERPVIALSSVSAGDRLRYSAAHELGHLVMHKDVRDYPADLEKEANLFASEFLFPEEAMRTILSDPLSIKLALKLKLRWKVSIQMIVRRAKDIGAISERRYRSLFQQIGARGWRTKEPIDVAVERPRLYRKAAEIIYDQEYVGRMAKDYGLSESLAKDLLSQYDSSYNSPPDREGV